MATDVTATVRAVVAVVDQATAPLRAIQAQFKAFGAPLQGLGAKMKAFGDTSGLTNVGKALGGAAGAAGKLAGSLARVAAPLAGLAGVAGIGGLTASMQAFAATGERLLKTAKATGETVERLQDLEHWADLGGVSAEALATSAGRVNKTLGAAAMGNKGAIKTFGDLGIAIKDAYGKTRTFGQIAPELARVFQGMTDPAERARIGAELFGKSWANIVPLLMEGPEALAKATAAVDKHGRILTHQAEKADAFGDAQQNLAAAIRSVANAISAALVPALLPLIEHMTAWVAANREWIAGTVVNTVTALAAAFRTLADVLGGAGRAFAVLVGLLAAVPLAGVITQVVALGKALYAVGVAINLFTPWGAALAALAAATLLLYTHWDKIGPAVTRTWETIKAFASGFQAGFVAVFEQGVARLREFLAALGATIGEVLEPVVSQVAAWGKRLWAAFSEVFTDVQGLLDAVGRWLWQKLGDALDPLIERVLDWGRRLLATFTQVWDWIKGSVTGAFDAIAPALTAALAPIRATAQRAWEGIKAVFAAGIDGLTALLGPLKTALGGIMGTLERAVSFVERGLRGIAGGLRGARAAVDTAAGEEAAAAEVAQQAAEKAALKRRRTAERAPGRAPGPWLPEIATPQGGAPANGRVDVVIKAENQPPGTRVAATTSGEGVRTRADVGYSMPQLQPAG